jgi:hypothetical protein
MRSVRRSAHDPTRGVSEDASAYLVADPGTSWLLAGLVVDPLVDHPVAFVRNAQSMRFLIKTSELAGIFPFTVRKAVIRSEDEEAVEYSAVTSCTFAKCNQRQHTAKTIERETTCLFGSGL